jgi:dTMP kinase
MKKGKFIVVDGGEGAGKTTLLKTLTEFWPKGEILVTHEPGGTDFADRIRKLVLTDEAAGVSAETQFALMWAARADHLQKKIIPALRRGVHVVSDRFDSSTFAYQIFGQANKRLEKLFWQTREVFLRDQTPQLYIFLDVDPTIGLARVRKRQGEKTHFDSRDLDFHCRVRKGFLKFLDRVPHRKINAADSPERVKAEFIRCVRMIL